jgi:predicted O-methyltransferase YrrM
MITRDILEKLVTDSKCPIDDKSLEEIVNRQEDASLRCPGIEAHYYRFFYKLTKLTKPKFIVELGTHSGISAACLASGNPQGLVTTINNKYQLLNECRRDNVTYLIQDSLTLAVVNRKIDILFIDTDHDGKRCIEEYKLYKNCMSENSVIFFDDIYLLDCMKTFWENFIPERGQKFELKIHGTAGMGVVLI